MNILLLFLLLWLAALPARAQLRLPDAEAVTDAASRGDTAALATLLDHGGSVEERNARGWPPLICAIDKHQVAAVRLLLARHADPNVLTEKNSSALDFAAGHDLPDIAALLLDAGADINAFNDSDSLGSTRSSLLVAVLRNRFDMVRFLLAHGAKLDAVNNTGRTVLMECCYAADAAQVEFLIGLGANVNARDNYGRTCLIVAASKGSEEIVRLLLAHGADVHATITASGQENGPRYGALEVATEQGWPYVIEALADAGATPMGAHWALNDELNAALNHGDYERAQAALANGASATEPDSRNVLPLTVAVLKGDAGIVRMLIKAGADVNRSPDDDPRGLPMALAREQIESAKTPPEKERFEEVATVLRKAGASQ